MSNGNPLPKVVKKKLPSVKTMRNKCDALLTPIIIKIHPFCMLGGEQAQVAHHFVHKSKSSRLRYELENLIPLCNKCHQRLHHNESYEAGLIISYKGLEWFNRLQKLKMESEKTDVHYYIANFKRLTDILNSL